MSFSCVNLYVTARRELATIQSVRNSPESSLGLFDCDAYLFGSRVVVGFVHHRTSSRSSRAFEIPIITSHSFSTADFADAARPGFRPIDRRFTISLTVTQDSARIPLVAPYQKVKAEKDRIDSRPHIPDPRRSGFTLCGKVIIGSSDSEKVWCWRCAAETRGLPRRK